MMAVKNVQVGRWFLVLLLGFMISCGGSSADVAVQNSSKAFDFKLQDLDGNTVQLKDFAGKVVILNFWDTWCPPCRMEIPDFVELFKDYGNDGLMIVGVALGRQGKDAVRTFRDKLKINYPVLMASPEVVQQYGNFQSIPTTFIIDPAGNIATTITGYRPKAEWLKWYNKLKG